MQDPGEIGSGPGAGRGEFVCLEVRTACPRCGGAVPLDGPVLEAACRSCGETVDVPRGAFHAVVADAGRDVFRMGRGVTADDHSEPGGREVHWIHGPDSPPCPACGGRTSPSDDFTRIMCPAHGAQGSIEKAPDWLAGMNSQISGLVPPRVEEVEPPQKRKISLTCSDCGSSLVADGSRRAVECSYCRTLNVLPDEVWSAIRPPLVPRRWWLALNLLYDARRVTPSASEEIRDGLGTLGCGLIIFLPFVLVLIGASAALHGWLVDKLGHVGFGIFVGLLGLVLLGCIGYCVPYARRYLRWRRIWKPENEVVARIDSWMQAYGDSGIAKLVLTPPGEPGNVLTTTFSEIMTRETFDRLGGRGGLIRAWVVPDNPELFEVQLTPTALE